MKLTHFKTLVLTLLASAMFVLSGCGSSGTPSKHDLVGINAPEVTVPLQVTAHVTNPVTLVSHTLAPTSGTTYTHTWTQVSGSPVTIANGTAANAVITASTTGTVVIQHIVTNTATGATTTTNHTVHITPTTANLDIHLSYSTSVSGGKTTSIHTSVSGGTAPYSYDWVQIMGTTLVIDTATHGSATPVITLPRVTSAESIEYTLTVTDDIGTQISKNIAFTIYVVPTAPIVPNAGTSTVLANPVSVRADGTTLSTVTVTVKDATTNIMKNAIVTLAQTGASHVSKVTDNADGTYTFTVSSPTVETVNYVATANGVSVSQLATVDFYAAPTAPIVPNAGTSTVVATPASVLADGTTLSTVTVTVKDATTAPILGSTVTLAQIGGSSTISGVTDNNDGTYSFTVTNNTVEIVNYLATADGVPISRPAAVAFYAAPPTTGTPPDATHSTVTVTPDSVVANGTNTATVTVTVKDVNSNPLTAETVTLAQTGNSIISAVTNHNDGTYTFTVSSTTDEVVNYVATAGGVSINPLVTILFDGTAPVFTSSATSSVKENQTDTNITLHATDAHTVSYSLSGADASSFDVNAITGVVTFKTAPDFESGKISYTFTATATDPLGNASTQAVTISIEDVNEVIIITHGGVTYRAIASVYTGKMWFGKNVGAARVCTSRTDTQCYGDLYQWGRGKDGHQLASSSPTATKATDITNAGSNFITGNIDWTTADKDGKQRAAIWSKTDGSSICPVGFRVPTSAEMEAETLKQGVIDQFTAFNSYLKFPSAGGRHQNTGNFQSVGNWANVWTSSPSITYPEFFSLYIAFDSLSKVFDGPRTGARSVRCIQD